jgi:two-component system, LytTR family, sensor kinase
MIDRPSTELRVPARTVLASIAGLWLTYFVLVTTRGWLLGIGFHDVLVWRRILVVLVSMACTAAFWPVLRLLDHRPLWQKVLAVIVLALPASLLLAEVNQRIFADVESRVTQKIGERDGLRIRRDEAGNLLVDVLDPPAVSQGVAAQAHVTVGQETDQHTRLFQLTDLALGRYFLLLAWAALYFSLVNAQQARLAERREGEFRRAAKAAELRSLRYQVNPHFLFNTLNSLSALVLTGKREAAETMIQTLAAFYRSSLADDPTGDHPLADEVALQRSYLKIEAVRFPDRLRVRFDIPEHLSGEVVPGMLLQPLVENSVKYAVARSSGPVTITLSARAEADSLVLTVSDDGPVAAAASGYGIGLANVRDRLAAKFGAAASIVSGPQPSGGWLSVIHMPLSSHD